MSQGLTIDFKHTAAHISDYIENGTFFNIFEKDDIKKIIENSNMTADQLINLLKQSSSIINAKDLFICTRKANVSIQNDEEVVSVLKNVKIYMKFNTFDGIIDLLNQMNKQLDDSREEIKRLHEEIKRLHDENNNPSREFLSRIAELKDSGDFEIMLKAFNEGLCEKIHGLENIYFMKHVKEEILDLLNLSLNVTAIKK